MLLILPISATIIPLLFKKWFLMSSLVCPFVSGVQIMTKTVPNIKEVQIVDRLFLYIVIGLDWTGLMSFLTGQDLTPKFAGQVLPDRTVSELIFLKKLTMQINKNNHVPSANFQNPDCPEIGHFPSRTPDF